MTDPALVMPYTAESAAGAFERALAECRKHEIRPKVANYDEWLSNLWDYVKQKTAEGNMVGFYPTGAAGTPVENGYPEGMEPWTEYVDKPVKPGEHFIGWPIIHNPLEERLDEILDKAGIKEQNSNINYFRIGDGSTKDEAFAKVYCRLITKKAIEFAEELSEFVKTDKLDFMGKFYELGNDTHNALDLYVPFNNLSKIVEWLATKHEYFHKEEFNHPAGVALFPGVSVVISKHANFDESIRHILDEVSRETGNDKRAFMQIAKERLENNVEVGYHFKWLKNNQEPKFAGFSPPKTEAN
jgi:hypothetical protein